MTRDAPAVVCKLIDLHSIAVGCVVVIALRKSSAEN